MSAVEAQQAMPQTELDNAKELQASTTAAGAAEAATPAAPCAASAGNDDPDLGSAALLLDKHARQLRCDMLDHMLSLKQGLVEQHQQRLQGAAAKSDAAMAGKQHELDAATAELARQREITRRTGNALFKAACWRRQRTLACLVWRAWRAEASRQDPALPRSGWHRS
jgi:hypothetical protein